MQKNSRKATVKIQIPMTLELKKIGEYLAEREGLSSYQELIRYWTMQAYRGRLHVFDLHEPEISPERELQYANALAKHDEDIAAGRAQQFDDADEFIDDLVASTHEKNLQDKAV